MYSFESRIRYSEVDQNQELSVTGIINYLQDCSTFQSEDLNLGITYLQEHHRAWWLSSWQIVIERYPRLGEEIVVSTWPYDFKGIYGYRNFTICDKKGNYLVKANSIWFFFDTSIEVPGKCKKIRNNYFPYFWYLMRAGIWVFDSRQPLYVRKKKHITYIQTWHGTPLKKLALDMDRMDMGGSTDIENYHEQFRVTCKDWDYLVSQNKFSTDIFRSCFAFKDRPILQIGYPRNDILINDNSPAKIREYKEKLGLPLDKKIILYAPTWRDNEYSEKGKYKFASKLDFDKAKEALSDKYIFIVKYHYLVSDKIDWTPYKGFVYTFDETKDIAWLYLVSDMLITDYSSVMFDYSILNRPMLFFAYDLEDYKENLRGFYFDFVNDIPGPISRDTDQLIKDIKEYNEDSWKEKYKNYHDKFNGIDDGHASQKVIDVIKKVSR